MLVDLSESEVVQITELLSSLQQYDLCRGESEFHEIAHFHPTFTNARPARGCSMATNYSTCNRSVPEYEQNVLFYSQCKCKVTVRI